MRKEGTKLIDEKGKNKRQKTERKVKRNKKKKGEIMKIFRG